VSVRWFLVLRLPRVCSKPKRKCRQRCDGKISEDNRRAEEPDAAFWQQVGANDMNKKIDINVIRMTRVEGHGNIVLKATDGTIEKLEWQVQEAPRFFEAMVRGRRWDEIQPIVSRICGICSVAHSVAAVKAIEDAMSIEVSEQTNKLRILALYAEIIESHSLHVGFLVAPDLFGTKSVVALASSHQEFVKAIVAIHRAANQWLELIGGRMTHPMSIRVGGFARLPTTEELKKLGKSLEDVVQKIETLAGMICSLLGRVPAFARDTEYVALIEPGMYSFYKGCIGSSDTVEKVDIHEFESVANEYISHQSTAKWAKWHRDSYAVGALSRYNLSADHLLPPAARMAKTFGLKKGCCNPFMNSVTQVVECRQVVEHALWLVDELLTAGISYETQHFDPKSGMGVGAVEAPRGTLFHRYAFDDDGRCTSANMCIPTNQNHGNIQKDFELLASQIINRGQDEICQILEMLVRAYDPCISCSTHYLEVEFV
jgi:sulfhydrogenase subunit alpha